ncbi:MAG: type II toxin-antitoxin system PemK/MazF family toxin [Spiroplasma sp.]|nr:type II toxin-antitoxin system PemK/MazF family toxin [Spiroplasma sp.]
MKKEYLIQDIWIVSYSVPYKPKNKLLRPFIITDIINGTLYGIPLTSFRNDRYKPDLGDRIIQIERSDKQSIIKPYQIIHVKEKFFIRKLDTVTPEIIKDINQKIDNNAKQYLSLKNTNAILREYIIERQNQKIINLQQEITQITNELALAKAQLILIQKDRELLFETANNLIRNLELKLENLQQQLTLTQ